MGVEGGGGYHSAQLYLDNTKVMNENHLSWTCYCIARERDLHVVLYRVYKVLSIECSWYKFVGQLVEMIPPPSSTAY